MLFPTLQQKESLPVRPQDEKGIMTPRYMTVTAVPWIIPLENQGHKSKGVPRNRNVTVEHVAFQCTRHAYTYLNNQVNANSKYSHKQKTI